MEDFVSYAKRFILGCSVRLGVGSYGRQPKALAGARSLFCKYYKHCHG